MQVWDVPFQIFAGKSMFERYVRGAQGFVLMYAIDTNPLTIQRSWQVVLDLLRSTQEALGGGSSSSTEAQRGTDCANSEQLPIVVVGNKRDVMSPTAEAETALGEVRDYCQQHKLLHVELSARENAKEPLQVVKLLVRQLVHHAQVGVVHDGVAMETD